MFLVACDVWCIVLAIIIVAYLLTTHWWSMSKGQQSRESYGACYKNLGDCPKDLMKGQLVLNPFVWPYSGSPNFDEKLSAKRLKLENFDNRAMTPRDDTPAYASRVGDFTGTPQNQLDTSNDNELRSLQQEPDHPLLSY